MIEITNKVKFVFNYIKYKQIVTKEREVELYDAMNKARASMRVLRETLIKLYE